MSVSLTCSCGKQLRVSDEMAGRRVKCPACREPVAVPAAAGSPRTTTQKASPAPPQEKPVPSSSEDVIRFRCACGKEMQARAAHAGKNTRCPACKEMVKIPTAATTDEPQERSRVRADRPMKKAPAHPEEDRGLRQRRGKIARDEDEDREDEDRPRRRRRQPMKRSTWIWVGVAGGVLLIGLIIGAIFLFSGSSLPPDLALVPGNAQGFVTIRLADMWNHDYTKQVLTQLRQKVPQVPDLGALCEKEMGLVPADVERLTFVADNVKNELAWGIVSTTKPYDRNKILSKLGSAQERKQGSKSYQVANMAGTPAAVYFHSDRIFLVGPEKAIQRSLTLIEGKRASGPLDSILKKAAGTHHLVGGMAIPPELVAMKGQLPAEMKSFAPLFDSQSASVQVDLTKGGTAELELGLNFPDSGKAQEGRKIIEQAMPLIKLFTAGFTQQMKTMLPGGKSVPVDQILNKAVDGLKINQSGSAVTLTMPVDLGDPGRLADAVAGALGGSKKSGTPGGPGTKPGGPGTRPGGPGTRPGGPNTQPGGPGTRPGRPDRRPGRS